MSLTSQDLQLLKAKFKANQHEFHLGNAYITEAAITDRIEELDPSWELRVQRTDPRANAGDGSSDVLTVVVHVSMTIKGVTRDGVGMNVVQRTKDGKREANEGEKAAATDAMKRAARLFGIGRYLLDLPDYVKDIASMAKFLGEGQPAQKPAAPANVSQMPNSMSKSAGNPQAWNKAEMTQFWSWWNGERGFSQSEILGALNVEKLGDWQGTIEAANARMEVLKKASGE